MGNLNKSQIITNLPINLDFLRNMRKFRLFRIVHRIVVIDN